MTLLQAMERTDWTLKLLDVAFTDCRCDRYRKECFECARQPCEVCDSEIGLAAVAWFYSKALHRKYAVRLCRLCARDLKLACPRELRWEDC